MAFVSAAFAAGAVICCSALPLKTRAAALVPPGALAEGGSLVVLPTVAGFLFALYQALAKSLV
jgi:hypothetical protein